MPDYSLLATQLADIVGNDALIAEPSVLANYVIDGIMPHFVAMPGDIQEIQAIVKVAAAQGASIIPRGSGTKMALGNPPRSADIVLSLARLNKIIEHDVANLTMTVQAGAKVEDLQRVVGRHGQLLPLDPSYPDEATVGGVVAANASGPHRLAWGAVRDIVLGMKVVMPNGDLINSGGKTVKNVSGYDLNKLFIGSLGTLGVIVEVTFRLLPLPERRAALLAAFPSLGQATTVAIRLLQSQYLPGALEILNPRALEMTGFGSNTFALAIALEDVAEAVDRQLRDLRQLCQEGGAPAVDIVTDQDLHRLWWAIRDLPKKIITAFPGTVALKASVVLSRVNEVCQAAIQAASRRGLPLALIARAGNGLVYAWFLGQEGDEQRQTEACLEVRHAAVAAGGWMVIETAPRKVKEIASVWGEPGSDFAIMRAIKSRLDPAGIMNPSRYIGGI